jgi:uncharacterized membrane protein
MPCSNCGTDFESRFCPTCGRLAAVPGIPPQAPIASGGMADNAAGALCYLAGLVTGIIFLVISPYNQRPAIRFHAFQSILFHVVWVGLIVAEMIVGVMLPFGVSMILSLFGLLVGVGGFVLWLYLMWKAYENQPAVLPVIGALAERQARGSSR